MTLKRSTLRLATIAVSVAIPASMAAQSSQQSTFDLSIANIMRGPEHYGREPAQVRWTADGNWIYFRWTEAGEAWDAPSSAFRVKPQAGAVPEKVSEAHADSVAPYLASGPLSRDGRLQAVSANGDLWLLDTRRGSARRLTETLANEMDPRFSLDEKNLLFVRESNTYTLEIASGKVTQLTDIRTGAAPRDPAAPTGMRGALLQDQIDLLEAIRHEKRSDSLAKLDRERAASLRLPPIYPPAGERIVSLSVSPDLKTAFAVTSSGTGGFGGFGGGGGGGGGAAAGAASSNTRNTIVPNYVTASGFTEDINARTKVGEDNNAMRAWRVDLATGKLQPIAVIGSDTTAKAASLRVVDWRNDGGAILFYATTADFKSRYLVTATSSGASTVVDHLRDTAWVAGPCSGCAGWLPDGRVWFGSESSGYAHLYAVGADGSGRTALTSGNWEVLQANISPDKRWFWLHTSETSAFVRQFWRMPINGGTRELLTPEVGGHTALVSPDGKKVANVFSTSNTPPELYVQDFNGRNMAKLTTSTSSEFRSHSWIKPQIVHFPASDGVQVPARIYKPSDVGASPNGAAVIFVHGAGYLHNVHEYWSSYSREYMFHHLLVSKGYVVLDIDFRASAGYGRDWRTAIYRHMGGRDLQDNVDGSRYLQKEFGISPERIGLYGGSYGGFITLMALFNAPDDFGAGAALRAVTDWAHYNHNYTGRILNLPQNDTLAYRKSSPIFFAEGLKDPLLIAHGMVDTNVHFQDVVRLAQRLIELGKTDWEMAVYPVENHAFLRPDSWTDEYRRILELFERTIGPSGSKVSGSR